MINERQLRQRKDAVRFATEYLLSTSQQNVCDFLNSGKMDTYKD